MATPPPGAGRPGAPAPEAGEAGDRSAYLTDLAPLPEAQPLFLWYGGVIETLARRATRTPPGQPLPPAVQARISWLYELAERIPVTHRDPLIMLTVGHCALDGKARAQLREVLDQLDRETEAAARTASAK